MAASIKLSIAPTPYARMRESMETFSTAGPLGPYEYYAKSASALIVDLKVTSPTPSAVDVRILLQGGALPEKEILKKVSDILTGDKVRPLTDNVTVSAPETVTYNIDFAFAVGDMACFTGNVHYGRCGSNCVHRFCGTVFHRLELIQRGLGHPRQRDSGAKGAVADRIIDEIASKSAAVPIRVRRRSCTLLSIICSWVRLPNTPLNRIIC